MIDATQIWPPVNRLTSTGYHAICPNHNDPHGSLHVLQEPDGFVALHCFACGKGATPDIVRASGLTMRDIMGARANEDKERRQSDRKSRVERAIASGKVRAQTAKPREPPTGCTLKQYADAKRLDIGALREWGLIDTLWRDIPAIEIPYYADFTEAKCKRYRVGLTGDRFRHAMGDDTILYGLWRLWSCGNNKPIILVEGESDCHVLWLRGFNAIGIPGASAWIDERDAQHFERFSNILLAVEPDKGGETLIKAMRQSRIARKVQPLVFSYGAKDAGALWLESDTPQIFDNTLNAMICDSVSGGSI